MIIYCLKCKQKIETIEVQSVQSKNGREMIKGICPICGTKEVSFYIDGIHASSDSNIHASINSNTDSSVSNSNKT